MQAGRELDALVAEKVMEIPKELISIKGSFIHTREDGSIILTREIDYYSTNISAAWEVVNKMWELKWCFDIALQARYTVFFRRDYINSTDKFISKEDTAAHAICLAALKAVGHLK